MSPTGSLARIATISLATMLLAGSPSIAQSADELDADNARLREELRIARTTIENLRQEVARLRAEVSELRGEEPQAPTAELPSDPLSCPDAMAAELRRRYERDLAPNAPRDERDLDAFSRLATEWCDEMRDDIVGRREWLAEIEGLAPVEGRRDWRARIRVYDEVSLLPLGGWATVDVPPRMVSRLEAEPEVRLWLIAAEIAADPAFNPARATRGPFDVPALVGPYVESGVALDWVGITPTLLGPTAQDEQADPGIPITSPPRPGRDR